MEDTKRRNGTSFAVKKYMLNAMKAQAAENF